MHSKERQKICGQCDGRIPINADICPYCAVEFSGGAAANLQFYQQQSLQKSLTSLYSPPYSVKNGSYIQADQKEEASFMKQAEQFKNVGVDKKFQTISSLGAPSISMPTQQESGVSDENNSFWPILLLSLGSNLLLIGLLQLLFSEKGFLRLEWDSSYWLVYCLAALPFIVLGYRKSKQLS